MAYDVGKWENGCIETTTSLKNTEYPNYVGKSKTCKIMVIDSGRGSGTCEGELLTLMEGNYQHEYEKVNLNKGPTIQNMSLDTPQLAKINDYITGKDEDAYPFNLRIVQERKNRSGKLFD